MSLRIPADPVLPSDLNHKPVAGELREYHGEDRDAIFFWNEADSKLRNFLNSDMARSKDFVVVLSSEFSTISFHGGSLRTVEVLWVNRSKIVHLPLVYYNCFSLVQTAI